MREALKKSLIVLVLALLLPFFPKAQQDPMYSQYMFNGLAFNPAYAGSRDVLSLSMLYRQQWVGLQGAPATQTFAAHLPSWNRRHGFGFSLVNDQISYLGQTMFSLDYAYRISLRKSKLSFGLRATANQYRVAWEHVDLKNRTDIVSTSYARKSLLPNAGFGIYWYSQNAYLGISAPRLLLNSFTSVLPELSIQNNGPGHLRRHFFANGGIVLKLSDFVQLKPSFMAKYVSAAPLQFDLNINAYFNSRFGAGVSYRTGDAAIGLLEYFITPQLRAGYAYGYPLTELNSFTSGSHELMITYEFRFGVDNAVSPRLF